MIERLGRAPKTLQSVNTGAMPTLNLPTVKLSASPARKDLVGVDVFVDWRTASGAGDTEDLAAVLNGINHSHLKLVLITSRGVKAWPNGIPETSLTDHWRCRFMAKEAGTIRHRDIVALLNQVTDAGLDFIKIESLCLFDGKPGYSLGQGQ